ncbi:MULTISPECIES: biopolymer transporter ExbD [Cysteiniphilum]|uniref:biopolymer transporter ExbD n=1 Tax=Cysteiniphilum TaxID=2056696 RepID=UPI00177FA3E5|nr:MULTISPECIES: biopolymer transporter ExbD [Cysteiniphilum]
MISSLNHHEHNGLEVDEPNLIPLLDFMLVLLVMFVLLAGPIQHLLKLPLPNVKGTSVTQSKSSQTTLYLKTHDYRINGEHFTSIDMLKSYLLSQKEMTSMSQITLAADKNIPLQTMLEVFAVLKETGLTAADIQVNH